PARGVRGESAARSRSVGRHDRDPGGRRFDRRSRRRRDARFHRRRRRLRACRRAPQGQGRQGCRDPLGRRALPARLRDAAGARPRLTALGRPLPRVEDRPLLTGSATFVDDVALPEMLHVAFLRSPVAHARITRIDLQAARAFAGVATVLTAADLAAPPIVSPCETPNAFKPPRPLLADGVVRFAGEPIAVAAAASRYAAEDALDRIELDLEPLEAIVDPGRGLADRAPRLHEHDSNLYVETRIELGEVDAAFQAP